MRVQRLTTSVTPGQGRQGTADQFDFRCITLSSRNRKWLEEMFMGHTSHTPLYRFPGQRRRKGRSPADDPACHAPCQPASTVTFATEASITPRVPFLNHSVGTTFSFPASGRWRLNGPRPSGPSSPAREPHRGGRPPIAITNTADWHLLIFLTEALAASPAGLVAPLFSSTPERLPHD